MKAFFILFFSIFTVCNAEPQTSVTDVIKIASERQVIERFKGSITFVGWSGKSTPDIKRFLGSLKIEVAGNKNYWIIMIDNNFSATTLGGGMIMALDDKTGLIIKLARWQ